MPSANSLQRAIAALASIAALTAFCLAVIVARSRTAARQAAGQMRTAFAAQAPLIDQANKSEQQRDKALSKNLAKIAQAERGSNRPAEIATRLSAAFPPLPHPVSIALAPRAVDESAPPAVITVPQDDLKPLFDRLEDCRACQEQLATAQQDLRDERAKVSALTIERDAAVKAARGGGFWPRLRTAAKWFGIGVVAGALAASAARR